MTIIQKKIQEPLFKQVCFLYILACIFWFIIFGLKAINFWLGMSIAASILAFSSISLSGLVFVKENISLKAVLWGIGSAFILYFIFYLGNIFSQLLFPFASEQVSKIYGIQAEGTWYTIAFVLFFITSPCEEIFWRGYIQRYTTNTFGTFYGILVSALLYGAVHIFSANSMLTLAALVAGLFWSALYAFTKNIFICILSHCIWTISIFVFFPI